MITFTESFRIKVLGSIGELLTATDYVGHALERRCRKRNAGQLQDIKHDLGPIPFSVL